jgi:hypothetical protein
MITTLDTTSWGKELSTGNAEFVETGLNLYIVSNVRSTYPGFGVGFGSAFSTGALYNSFVILQSDPVPPSPGPGASFGAQPPKSVPVATYVFPQPNTSFDPAVAFDSATGLLHIIGTRDTPTGPATSNPQLNDLIKFTYNVNTMTLTGPTVITGAMGSRIRSAYDITVLNNGDTLVAVSLTDPALQVGTVASVTILSSTLTLALSPAMTEPFVEGQWLLLDGFTNAQFLNGALVQVATATTTQVTANVTFGNYPTTTEPTITPSNGYPGAALPSVSPVGNSLLAVELAQGTDIAVPGTAIILESSPSRTGNQIDGVSLLTNGLSVELYYQSHPKVFTGADQQFTINLIGYNFPVSGFGSNFGNYFGDAAEGFGLIFGDSFGLNGQGWDEVPQVLTTFSARYSDNRLTVIGDAFGNRWLSQTYWSQSNHPEGITGSVLLGVKNGQNAWTFHPTFGTTSGGSFVQSTLAIAQNGSVNLVYLLEPFTAVSIPPAASAAAWPLEVASVNPITLNLTNVPGFYNNRNFTWLRGTKSLIDNTSLWAVVAEYEIPTPVAGELHSIPSVTVPNPPFTVQVTNFTDYFEDAGVVYYPSLKPFTAVDTDPQQGQYTVDQSTGVYTFNIADQGQQIAISYSYISAILPVYASFYNVPPIASVTPVDAIVWRNGTFYSTNFTNIFSITIVNNVITVYCMNDFTVGQSIALFNFVQTENQFLNGVTLTVTAASATQFSAAFTHANYGTSLDGMAAQLVSGDLQLSAAASTDADTDPLDYIWTENYPNLSDVTLNSSGATATLNVNTAIGPAEEAFQVGLSVIDLYADLVTQRHPALDITNVTVSSGTLTATFTAPAGAIVPIAGEQVMFYDVTLGPPVAPTVGVTPGGSLPEQTPSTVGFGYNYNYGFGQTGFSIIVTYLNEVGETVGSTSTIYANTIPAGYLMTVTSPAASGDATQWNVYIGNPGQEQLQEQYYNGTNVLSTPIPLGTGFIEPPLGFNFVSTNAPTTSTAFESWLNDQVLTLSAGTNSNTLVVNNFSPGFGSDFGVYFGGFSAYSASVTGDAISQFQFQQVNILVPENADPTITFPSPQWTTGNTLATNVARNTTITITPDQITDPTTQFPVIYEGVTDPDDSTTYQWTQVSGTTVALPKGTTHPFLEIATNGVNINGETLVFSITVNDGVNPAVTATINIPVAAYVFTANNTDTLQLSRAVFSASAPVTNISIVNGVGTITANNTFVAGQSVWFEGLTGAAAFLNGIPFTVLPTGFGQSFNMHFGSQSLSPTSFQIYDAALPNFAGAATGIAYSSMPISLRNTPQIWSPLDISIIFNNLRSVKRTSVLDGSDRYIVISPQSVLVYAVFPSATPAAVLLRKLLLPNSAFILDAVHTEQDYTLVLDSEGNIWRYSSAPNINTDDPDTQIILADYTELSFADSTLAFDVSITTTVSNGNQRVVVLSGEEGALLMQLNTTTLAVTSLLELDVASNLVYGASKVQFVRWNNMGSIASGRILLGTIANQTAQITNVQYSGPSGTPAYQLTFTAQNSFVAGDAIKISGLTSAAASVLNGYTVDVISVTPNGTQFTASLELGVSIPSFNVSDTGLAESLNSGSTYETLIDLTNDTIIGTWDKSKLKNQFVHTGEIMFDPDSTYSGGPTPPLLQVPTTVIVQGVTNIALSWQQLRPDLITSYIVQYALGTTLAAVIVPSIAPYSYQVPAAEYFTADEGVFDITAGVQLVPTTSNIVNSGQYSVTQSGLYQFNGAQAGHALNIFIRQEFQNFQTIGAGSIQSIISPITTGLTYYFRVQAVGPDGPSAYSNVQQITV